MHFELILVTFYCYFTLVMSQLNDLVTQWTEKAKENPVQATATCFVAFVSLLSQGIRCFHFEAAFPSMCCR